MIELSSAACVKAISAMRTFDACVDNGAFFVKIEDYGHFVCTAIHNGHRMRPEIEAKCAWSDAQRRHEEDPYIARIIQHMPITVTGGDSRFEYDLNRAPEQCIYEEAWGKPVWKTPLSKEEKNHSLAKHQAFYSVLGALYGKLEDLHPAVLSHDVHSYNSRRTCAEDDPMFNIGTEQLDTERWQPDIDEWAQILGEIYLPGITVRVAVNEVFFGRGYHATFTTSRFPNILLLPTEIKKTFVKEDGAQPEVKAILALQAAFGNAIIQHSKAFRKRHWKMH